MKKWIGDKQNGIELRYEEGEDEVLDEVCLYVGGKCVMHMEATSKDNYWFGFYVNGHEVHMNISSKSHIEAKAEEQ